MKRQIWLKMRLQRLEAKEMTKEDLLKEMRDCVGYKEPIGFFRKMVDVFILIFEKLDSIEKKIETLETSTDRIRVQSALSIQWEPKVAADMLCKQIDILRKDKDTYHKEISDLKKAYTEDRVTQNYHDFCKFWQDTLGWNPFLE